jgi:hypothetical protein
VPSAGVETDSSPRDTHLLMIASLGRLGWQGVTGYGKRALVETARRTEAVVGAVVLNRMLDAARPNSVRRSVAPA